MTESQKQPNKGGRPAFVPTDDERKMVSQMVAVGIPQDEIAMCVRDGIDVKTLRKAFGHEIATAKTRANARVAGSLFNRAINGSDTAAIWWTKSRMGWSEKQALDLTNSDGSLKPQPGLTIDPSKLSTETLRELLAAMKANEGGE